jgi:hypothetical protein
VVIMLGLVAVVGEVGGEFEFVVVVVVVGVA